MSMGKRLKKARIKRKLTQDQVANALDVHRTTIGKYENDESEPSLDKFAKMIDLYHADANYILFGNIQNETIFRNLPDVLIQKLYFIINDYYETLELNKDYKS